MKSGRQEHGEIKFIQSNFIIFHRLKSRDLTLKTKLAVLINMMIIAASLHSLFTKFEIHL